VGSQAAQQASEPLRQSLTRLTSLLSRGQRQQLDYNSVIISLYGSLESFVEDLVEAYADALNNSVSTYAELSEPVRRNHERLSALLLQRSTQASTPDTKNETATAIANLHACLQGQAGFQLNVGAFAWHTSNVRTPVIDMLFGQLDVSNICASFANDARTRRDRIDRGLDDNDPHFHINDLADRRNEVAHGEALGQTLSLELLRDYIRSVRLFGEVLFDRALASLCDVSLPQGAVCIGNPTRVLHSGRVVCFEVQDAVEIGVGDSLVAKRSADWQSSAILEIQMDKMPAERLALQPGERVGLRCELTGSLASLYYVVPG
jgi:hypothetical protein